MVLVSKRSSCVTFQMNVEIILMKSLVVTIWRAATLKQTSAPGSSKLMTTLTGLERMVQLRLMQPVLLEITAWVSQQVYPITIKLSKSFQRSASRRNLFKIGARCSSSSQQRNVIVLLYLQSFLFIQMKHCVRNIFYI